MMNLSGSLLLLAGLLVGGSMSRLDRSSATEALAAQVESLQGRVDAIQQAQWQHGLRHALAGHDAAMWATRLTMARAEGSDWSTKRSNAEVRGILDAVLLDYFAAVEEYESAASQAQELMHQPKSRITERVSEQAATTHAHARQFENHQRTSWTSTLELAYRAAASIDEADHFEREYRAGRSRVVKSTVMQEVVPTWKSLEHLLGSSAEEK